MGRTTLLEFGRALLLHKNIGGLASRKFKSIQLAEGNVLESIGILMLMNWSCSWRGRRIRWIDLKYGNQEMNTVYLRKAVTLL